MINHVKVKSDQDHSQLELTGLRGQLEKIENIFRVEKQKYQAASETHNHQVAQFKSQIENLNMQIEHIQNETSKTTIDYQVINPYFLCHRTILLCRQKTLGEYSRQLYIL